MAIEDSGHFKARRQFRVTMNVIYDGDEYLVQGVAWRNGHQVIDKTEKCPTIDQAIDSVGGIAYDVVSVLANDFVRIAGFYEPD